jgi:hypothetical protein
LVLGLVGFVPIMELVIKPIYILQAECGLRPPKFIEEKKVRAVMR